MRTRLLLTTLLGAVLLAACSGGGGSASTAKPSTAPAQTAAAPADSAAPAGGGSVDCTAVKAAMAKIIVSVQLLAQMRDPDGVDAVKSKTIGDFDPDEFLAALHELHALDGQTSVMGDPKAAIDAYEDAGAGREDAVRHQARDPGRHRHVQHARRHDRGVPRPPGGDRRGDGQRPLLIARPADTGRMSGHDTDDQPTTARTTPFVPAGFVPPAGLDHAAFRLRPLGPEHNASDYAAWTTSIDHIRRTPGWQGLEWPHPMTLDENLGDLVRHAGDFAARTGFTYTVLQPGADVVIGCVYIYPAADPAFDARCRSWVRADVAPLDALLYRVVGAWLADAWPFRRVDYAARGTYREGPAGRRLHRRPARLAAGHLSPRPGPRPRRGPRGRGDDQAERAAVLRPGRQHLRAARREGPRERVPLRPDRARPRGHRHRGP